MAVAPPGARISWPRAGSLGRRGGWLASGLPRPSATRLGSAVLAVAAALVAMAWGAADRATAFGRAGKEKLLPPAPKRASARPLLARAELQ
ncbi:MAG TPA: hypothetical protein VFR00_05160, partial [Hyphomicrobiaceae bacterium]|nr:hypothetical protein [Hyphomicrobiaceae bacterium]